MSDQQPPQGGILNASGQVARSLVDGLKGQPALIFILLLNCIVFAAITYAGIKREKRELLILERCLPKLHSDVNGTTTGGLTP